MIYLHIVLLFFFINVYISTCSLIYFPSQISFFRRDVGPKSSHSITIHISYKSRAKRSENGSSQKRKIFGNVTLKFFFIFSSLFSFVNVFLISSICLSIRLYDCFIYVAYIYIFYFCLFISFINYSLTFYLLN